VTLTLRCAPSLSLDAALRDDPPPCDESETELRARRSPLAFDEAEIAPSSSTNRSLTLPSA
jgi:hypothetical protein